MQGRRARLAWGVPLAGEEGDRLSPAHVSQGCDDALLVDSAHGEWLITEMFGGRQDIFLGGLSFFSGAGVEGFVTGG